MEKHFVNYQQAMYLKSIGFDEPCFAYYQKSAVIGNDTILPIQIMDKASNFNDAEYSKMGVPFCSAPLKSQVVEWFREKYNLRGFIGFRPNVKKFDYHIYDMSLSGMEYVKQRTITEFNKDPKVGTYEEAESACIDKLIEIIKHGR